MSSTILPRMKSPYMEMTLTSYRQQSIFTCRDNKGCLAVLELHTPIGSQNLATSEESPQPCYQTTAPTRTSNHCGQKVPELLPRHGLRGSTTTTASTRFDDTFQSTESCHATCENRAYICEDRISVALSKSFSDNAKSATSH